MSNELQTKLDAIKLDKDTNLKPENLKKGVTCLGIVGTAEGETLPEMDVTIPLQMEYDPFANNSFVDIPLPNSLNNANVSVYISFYGKWNTTDNWMLNSGINGDMSILQGGETKYIRISVGWMSIPLGRISIAILANGYKPLQGNIDVIKKQYNYGKLILNIYNTNNEPVSNFFQTSNIRCTSTEEGAEVVNIVKTENTTTDTFDIYLTGGYWTIEVLDNDGNVLGSGNWNVNNSEQTWLTINADVPGFTVIYNILTNGDNQYIRGANGEIKVYDSNDTLLDTITIDYCNRLQYTYTKQFDHYTITLNAVGMQTFNVTYTSSYANGDIHMAKKENTGVATLQIDLDNTTIRDVATLMDIGFTCKNSTTEETYSPTYVSYRNYNSGMIEAYVEFELPVGSYEISTVSDKYEQKTIYSDVIDGGYPVSFVTVYTKVPNISVTVKAKDLEGNYIPISAWVNQDLNLKNMSLYNGWSISSKDDVLGFQNTINVHNQNKLLLQIDMNHNATISTLLTLDFDSYTEDTEVELEWTIPVSSEAWTMILKCNFAGGQNDLTAYIPNIYQGLKLSDETPVEIIKYDDTLYVAKVPTSSNTVILPSHTFTASEIEYLVEEGSYEVSFGTAYNYYGMTANVTINNTYTIRSIFIMRNNKQTSTEKMYKIEVLINNNSILTFDNSSYGNIFYSTRENDTIEVRGYKNTNTTTDPVWTENYWSSTQTVTSDIINTTGYLYAELNDIDAYFQPPEEPTQESEPTVPDNIVEG